MPNHYRAITTVVVLAGGFLSGCSTSAEPAAIEEPAVTQLETVQPSVEPVTAVPTIPTHPESDYGEIVGTLQIDVENEDGYTAVIDVAFREAVLLTQAGQLGPSCLVAHYQAQDHDVDIHDASAIVVRTLDYRVTLGDHAGFPLPTGFAPIIEESGDTALTVVNSGFTNYGSCETGGGLKLTDAGYEGRNMKMNWGRSTPAEPLPTSINDVTGVGEGWSFDVESPDSINCTIRPTDDFILEVDPYYETTDFCRFGVEPA